MDKQVVEALKKLLPEDQVNEVTVRIQEMLDEAKNQLEEEYNEKLEEAYSELAEEVATAKRVAEEGYEEAYVIINELRHRIELQDEEYKQALEEGYEEAYQMVKEEREKNKTIEIDLYEEYDKKLNEMKEYIVDKVDKFLQFKGQEMYENARRDVLNDPEMASKRVALDKIVDIAASYMSDGNFASANSGKLEEMTKQLGELRGQLKIMEARNIKISTENTKLEEACRKAQTVITEHKKQLENGKDAQVITEQKNRMKDAENVTGRGKTNTDDGVVISEFNNNHDGVNEDILKLAGIIK